MSEKAKKTKLKSKEIKDKSRKSKSEHKEEVASKKADTVLGSLSDKRSFAEDVDMFLTLNDDELAKLPEEKVLEMRKSINPYGRTIAGSDKFLTFSVTQLSHQYWEKFITTAMIGYLNRMCDEWKVPSGVPVVSVYEYLENPAALDTPEIVLKKDDKSVMYDYELNRAWMKKRIIVKEFFEEMFQFNPDEHVRSSYRPNYADSTRKPLHTMAAKIATKCLEKTDAKFRADKALHEDIAGLKKKKIRKIIKSKDGKIREVIREVTVEEPIAPRLPTSKAHLDESKPVDPDLVDTVFNMIPPHDMFGRFKMYRTENYEQIRDAVLHLYNDKPDLELALNPYGVFDTKDAAKEFQKQHSEEVIAEIFIAETGKWNMFDCFKEQRESVNFYNKNTAVLEEMVKQIERDEKLGKDLMEKRVHKEKKKNIVQAGPDAENFKKWRDENNDIQKLGAKHIGDMADEDMPEDAIQVDVWKVAKGGLELTKDKFYSKSESPDFVKESASQLKTEIVRESAQPVEPRADNL
jgi:hypothetical protein